MDLMHAWDSAAFPGGGGNHGQYAQNQQYQQNQSAGAAGASGAQQHDEDGIFGISKVEYPPPRAIVDLVTSNNILIMALENSHIIRLDLSDPSELEDIEISKMMGQIRRLFLDPTGNHLIISTLEDNYYLHRSWKGTKKPRALSKTKGIFIDAIGWDLESGSSDPFTTGTILVGSSQGQIFELNIDAHEGGALVALNLRGLEKIWRVLFKLPLPTGAVAPSAASVNSGADGPNAIHGLSWFRFPHQPTKMVILVSSATRLYQFVGVNTFEQTFQHYNDNLPDFQEFPILPGSPTVRGELAIYVGPPGDASKQQRAVPKSIAWLTGAGLFMADIMLASQNMGEGVLENSAHIPYPLTEIEAPVGRGAGVTRMVPIAPVSVALTEFHYMLLYPNGILLSMSRITNDIVYEGRFPVNEVLGLSHDPRTGITFSFAPYHVYEVHIRGEDRNVWQAYLQKGLFALAQQYSREPWQRDRVWSTQADHYFNQKQYELAAQFYGKTGKSFEEVTLRFIHMGEHDALRAFLKEKLSHMNPRDNMQMTIVCTWLTELYLSKLNKLETDGSRQLDTFIEEFRAFLEDYSKLKKLDTTTTFNLISSHGRTKELLYYATLVKDYDKVIGYHIQHGDYDKALDVLVQHRDSKLFYKYSPVLMANCPQRLVTVLMSLEKDVLEPRQLIPALMRYKPQTLASGEPNQAIRYLQWCVQQLRSKDPAIHNLLLSLYAETENDAALMSFLQQQQKEIYFDLEYALRLCMKHNKQRACVLLYSKMGLFEEAVELALQVDIDLAKQIADQSAPDDEVDAVSLGSANSSALLNNQNEMRKKLWLRIARHVVEDQKDITKAMEFLKDRNDLLKIEDILPFFPDFVLIDDFKDEICRSLQEYNKHIEDLEHEMSEATKSADAIRQDIENLKNKYGFVSGNQNCDICHFPILTRAFYLFPCQHVFHRSCLAAEVQRNVDEVRSKKIAELMNTIRADTQIKRAADLPTVAPSQAGPASFGTANALAGLPSPFQGLASALPAAASAFAAAALGPSSSSSSQQQQQPSLLSADIGSGRQLAQQGMSSAEAQVVQDELDKHIAGECVLCGDIMIRTVSKPFVDLSGSFSNLSQLDLIRSWEI